MGWFFQIPVAGIVEETITVIIEVVGIGGDGDYRYVIRINIIQVYIVVRVNLARQVTFLKDPGPEDGTCVDF